MDNYAELDRFIQEDVSPQPGIRTFDAAIFLGSLRKLAAPGQPAPDQDLAQHAQEVAVGEEAAPAEAEAHTEAGAPDTSGHLEGEFAVPVEQVVQTMASIVSNSMRQHAAYAYYGETMRGLGRGELAELFDEQGKDELEEMHYFLRRMGVLVPGGVPIPVAPTPTPSDDPQTALDFLISGEQQAIVFFKTLHAMLGENPMKYTLESLQSSAQEHLDKLWQYMPAGAPEKQASAKSKIASVIGKIKTAAKKSDKATGAAPAMPVVIPEPGTESPADYVAREQQLQLQQSEAEKADLTARLQQTSDMAVANQAAAEQASAAAQQSAMEVEQANQQTAMATDQASQAMDAATASQTQAAAEADAKMRLSMRIQQMRQELSTLASVDPVGEEGLSHAGGAGPGAPMTPGQQDMAAQEQAMNDQMAQEQMAAEATGGGKAKKETAQAQSAQQNAAVQTQQAQVATQGA